MKFRGYQLPKLVPEREGSEPGWSALLQEGADELLLFLPGEEGALGRREGPYEPLDGSHKGAPLEFRVLEYFRSGRESLWRVVGEMPCGSGGPRRGRERRGQGG